MTAHDTVISFASIILGGSLGFIAAIILMSNGISRRNNKIFLEEVERRLAEIRAASVVEERPSPRRRTATKRKSSNQ